MHEADTNFFNLLREQLQNSVTWKTGSDWQHSDFVVLADRIEEATQAPVSVSTLKRIWKSPGYIPRPGTLNILARYVGFSSWYQFMEAHQIGQTVTTSRESDRSGRRLRARGSLVYATAGTLVVLALVFAMVHRVWQAPKSVPVPFSTDVTVKEGVPTTIVFRYQLPEPATDSFSIQLSWNPLERTPIQSDRNFLTATYYYPGLHRSKLLCNGMIACQRNVYITAPDWVVLYRYTPTDVLPHYIPLQEVLGEGCLSVTPDILVAQGAQIDNEVYTSFIYSNSKLETDADAMYLEASFRNIPLNYATVCGESWLYIYADSGDVAIPLVNKGCEGNVSILFSERFIDGKTELLSGFGKSMNTFQKLGLKVNHLEVNCLVNDTLVYAFPYTKKLGTLRAMQFFFHGAGSVEYVKLENCENRELFRTRFDLPGATVPEQQKVRSGDMVAIPGRPGTGEL